MNPEEHHVALPKLYGAPAYARPPRRFDAADRPPDPDDLPLEAFRPDEGALLPELASIGSMATMTDVGTPPIPSPAGTMTARPTIAPAPPDEAGMDGAADDPALAADGVGLGGAAAGDPAASTSAAGEEAAPTLQPRPFSVRALARFLQRR